MSDQNDSENTKLSDKSRTTEAQQQRRDAMKKGAVAGGVVAGAVWSKPVINATVLPAHAATSLVDDDSGQPVSMSGPTGSPMTASIDHGGGASIAAAALASVVPAARAAGTPPSQGPASFAFYSDEQSLCVTLDFPQGKTPGGPINVSVAGPEIESSYYYFGSWYVEPYMIEGNGSGTLSGLDFSVDIGPVTVSGCVTDNDFTGAEGYVVLNQTFPDNPAVSFYSNFYPFEGGAGYGGPFAATAGGGCSVGSGYSVPYNDPF